MIIYLCACCYVAAVAPRCPGRCRTFYFSILKHFWFELDSGDEEIYSFMIGCASHSSSKLSALL